MRKGDYIGTYTGKQFWPLDPKPEEVCIEDIAHALSQICRFNGHTKRFYSVIHHSLNVAYYLEKTGHSKLTQLYGLLHDTAEAYVCDIPRPLKRFLAGYEEIEKSVQWVIYKHFNLDRPSKGHRDSVKLMDNYVLALESRVFMQNTENWDLVETKAEDKLRYTGNEMLNPTEHLWTEQVLLLLNGIDRRG